MSQPQPTFRLSICRFPGNNQEHPKSSGYFADLLVQCSLDERISEIQTFELADTPITMSRNRLVRFSLAKKCDYILMLDSDMAPDCEPGAPPFWDVAWKFMMDRRHMEQVTVDKILERHPPTGNPEVDANTLADAKRAVALSFPPATIAAPYCGPPPRELPYIFRWSSQETGAPDVLPKLEMFDRDDAAVRTGIEEVAALPTGLILYDARVFERLPRPWFAYEWADEYQDDKISTEDVYQTRNASFHGMPQYVAWDCWAGHIKLKTVRKPQMLKVKHIRDELRRSLMSSKG